MYIRTCICAQAHLRSGLSHHVSPARFVDFILPFASVRRVIAHGALHVTGARGAFASKWWGQEGHRVRDRLGSSIIKEVNIYYVPPRCVATRRRCKRCCRRGHTRTIPIKAAPRSYTALLEYLERRCGDATAVIGGRLDVHHAPPHRPRSKERWRRSRR